MRNEECLPAEAPSTRSEGGKIEECKNRGLGL